MDTNEMFNTIKLFCTLIILLTVSTEIGFLIQKIIVDIRTIAIASAISILLFIIISVKSIIFAALSSLVIYIFLLDKLVNKDEEIPGVVLASIIGIGIGVVVLINYGTSIFNI
ncbi:hypothetical protein ACTNDG_08610 [Clostridium sp. HCP1S3_B4]|uniref:hypothetical protein n=1 Tax=unclassified Clostridium TaxID=2614128 RepID=UPI001692A88D|nr:hypothetical protein [Clostridiales bacterium]NLK22890.1 hypothetical protein [Clostridiales bacterium]